MEQLLVVFVGFLVGKSEQRKERLCGLGGTDSEEENKEMEFLVVDSPDPGGTPATCQKIMNN
uniref:Uncharacterized protein n=2 Tax=Solanum tuberosum TaxID=4113 RepID=M0ZUH0_SOLTU